MRYVVKELTKIGVEGHHRDTIPEDEGNPIFAASQNGYRYLAERTHFLCPLLDKTVAVGCVIRHRYNGETSIRSTFTLDE